MSDKLLGEKAFLLFLPLPNVYSTLTTHQKRRKQRKLSHGLMCPQAMVEAEGKTRGEAETGSAYLGSETVMAWCISESGNKTKCFFFLECAVG